MDLWNATDEQMRAAVVRELTGRRDEMEYQAERGERDAEDISRPIRDRCESEACARYSRLQAAHYQQAIDLLAAAPMPQTEESTSTSASEQIAKDWDFIDRVVNPGVR